MIHKCKKCNKEFETSARAFYCEDCRVIKKNEYLLNHALKIVQGTTASKGELLVCERCGCPAKRKGALQKYCEACALAVKKETAKAKWQKQKAKNAFERSKGLKKCIICDTPLTAKHAQKYCSEQCKAEATLNRQRVYEKNRRYKVVTRDDTITHICTIFGNSFKAGKRALFCQECKENKQKEYARNYAVAHQSSEQRLKKCVICGTEMKVVGTQRYCCEKCRRRGRVLSQLKYQKNTF